MKKIIGISILISLITLLSNNICLALSEYDDFNQADNAFQYDRPVDNNAYEKIINEYKKKKEKKEKTMKKEVEKPLNKLKKKNKYIDLPENQGNSEMSIFMEKLKEPLTVCFSQNAYVSETGDKIPMGYYKLEAQKVDENKDVYYINLFQGRKLIAKVPSNVTKDDFGMKTINFAKVIPDDSQHLKIIYGSLKVNLEAKVVLE